MFNDEHFSRFMNFVMPDDGCMELICWQSLISPTNHIEPAKYPIVQGGWFTKIARVRDMAKRLKNVSAYVTFNPVTRDRLAQSDNSMIRIKKDEGTKAEDILCLRFLLVDIDYARNPKISATKEELAQTLELRDRIIFNHPEIADNAIWGCSGNGAYILSRLPDCDNNKVEVGKAKAVLESLASMYGEKKKSKVHIDVQPHFANAHIGLPGTMKCKGSSTDDRPHRLITVDGGNY